MPISSSEVAFWWIDRNSEKGKNNNVSGWKTLNKYYLTICDSYVTHHVLYVTQRHTCDMHKFPIHFMIHIYLPNILRIVQYNEYIAYLNILIIGLGIKYLQRRPLMLCEVKLDEVERQKCRWERGCAYFSSLIYFFFLHCRVTWHKKVKK